MKLYFVGSNESSVRLVKSTNKPLLLSFYYIDKNKKLNQPLAKLIRKERTKIET